ncbi:hypothetical protein GCM10023108_28480 [Saccharopolyspora hordei]
MAAGAVAVATGMRTEQGQPVPVEVSTPVAVPPASTPPPATSAPPPEQPVAETEPGGDTETVPATPVQTRWCTTLTYQGEQRGTGCFEAVGDHLVAHDTNKDGLWVKTVAKAVGGKVVECEDTNSTGNPVDCDQDLSEKGRLRFQVELWDGRNRIAETPWSDPVPIGQ